MALIGKFYRTGVGAVIHDHQNARELPNMCYSRVSLHKERGRFPNLKRNPTWLKGRFPDVTLGSRIQVSTDSVSAYGTRNCSASMWNSVRNDAELGQAIDIQLPTTRGLLSHELWTHRFLHLLLSDGGRTFQRPDIPTAYSSFGYFTTADRGYWLVYSLLHFNEFTRL